jgi:hypothetical protein
MFNRRHAHIVREVAIEYLERLAGGNPAVRKFLHQGRVVPGVWFSKLPLVAGYQEDMIVWYFL